MTIVPFAELKAVPWRNGLGITREIAVEPRGATMDDFAWRVSIADVDTASPFSRFPGIDRTIVLLEGAGFTMRLDDERSHALTIACEPYAFAGEATVEVSLTGGATRDFNLMVRRGVARGTIDVVQGPVSLMLDSETVLLYLAQGDAVVRSESAEWPVRAGDSVLAADDGVAATGEIVLAADATALLVRISPTTD